MNFYRMGAGRFPAAHLMFHAFPGGRGRALTPSPSTRKACALRALCSIPNAKREVSCYAKKWSLFELPIIP